MDAPHATLARWLGTLCLAAGLSGCLIQIGSFALFEGDVVATAAQTFCERRVPGTQRDPARSALGDVCNLSPRVIAHGGDMQQLAAVAYLRAAQAQGPTDVSLVNGGGVRTDFPGQDAFADASFTDITVDEVFAALPFRNTLVRLTLTGAQLKTALEDGLDYLVRTPGVTGAYPYAAALRFEVNLAAPRGARVSNLQLRNSAGQYLALDPAATLRIVTSAYLAGGGDGYATLATITGAQRQDLGQDEADALMNYVRTHSPLLRPPVGEYSTQAFSE